MEKLSIIAGIGLTIVNIIVIVLKPFFKTLNEWNARGRKIRNDYRSIKELEEMSREDKMFILLILNHIIDGNNIEKLKETRKELIEKIPKQIGGKKDE